MGTKKRQPPERRLSWSGKRDPNNFSETTNNQYVAKRRKDTRCKMGETFVAYQDICANDM